MRLSDLCIGSGSQLAAADALELIRELFPICRSITGDGVRRTFELIGERLPLERHEVPTGTPAYDWEVPPEWNIRNAYVADAHGCKVVDFRDHNLHVVNYSVPVRRTMSLDELQPHLHSLPEHPGWIPYRTTYYHEDWGFCLRHCDRERLGAGPYEVVIDADLSPGSLSYAECVVPGTVPGEGLVYTHTCHPSLANDNLSGIAVAAVVAAALRETPCRLTWRIVFGPGTIGSLVWLSRNEDCLRDIRCGLVVGLLGDAGALTYKRSRRGDTATDRAVELAFDTLASGPTRIVEFEPYGYDERQFCSPGFNLPVGRLTRSSNGTYPEYHTSADDLTLMRTEQIAGSIQALAGIVSILDGNRRLINLNPKGEPRLGKRGLYGSIGAAGPREFEHALLWLLNLGDGAHDLIKVAKRSRIDYSLLASAASALERAGLVRTGEDASSEINASPAP